MSDNAGSRPDDADPPTTTHAEPGEGNPRLIFVVGSEQWSGGSPREFGLLDPVTRIGAGADMDLRLDGLEDSHAEIRHDENDEYVLFVHGAAELSSELTGPSEEDHDGGRVLRTGARVDLGDWQMSYYREEFADHGRPFGGRQGGEGEHQAAQPERDGDSPSGGSSPR
jgi:hypothetical protein